MEIPPRAAGVALIRKAYDFSRDAHEGQKRTSGEPYFLHDLNDLAARMRQLYELYFPQRESQWWRDQGAPGADDAVAGLAEERTRQCAALLTATELVDAIVAEVKSR